MPRGFEIDKQDVLLALYGHFITTDEPHEISPQKLKDRAKLRLSVAHIALLLRDLSTSDAVSWAVAGQPDLYEITTAGIRKAEDEILGRGQTLDQFDAEFRRSLNTGMIVDTDHPDLIEAGEVLSELHEHLRTDNDVGDLTPEDRQVAQIEVSELRDTITKRKVRTHSLWVKANETLLWIIEKGSTSIVGDLAKTALHKIQTFITVFFN